MNLPHEQWRSWCAMKLPIEIKDCTVQYGTVQSFWSDNLTVITRTDWDTWCRVKPYVVRVCRWTNTSHADYPQRMWCNSGLFGLTCVLCSSDTPNPIQCCTNFNRQIITHYHTGTVLYSILTVSTWRRSSSRWGVRDNKCYSTVLSSTSIENSMKNTVEQLIRNICTAPVHYSFTSIITHSYHQSVN
jgi:hypothetical protein